MQAHQARHIQDFGSASQLEPHWGYADRVIPCTNDAGSCEYLDVVYHSHDVGMLYSGILWSAIGGILLLWAVMRTFQPSRLSTTFHSFLRKYTLPSTSLTPLFGNTSRVQVIVLVSSVIYLSIFSFAGITYKTWITPVKASPGVSNTRTSLGPWSDRVATFAFALTPLSILLSNRESLLSLITGIPYYNFNFLHRWLGHIILLQSLLHTLGWIIIETKLYQPQPTVAVNWIKQTYMIWGCIAMILLLTLWILALPISRRKFGYEFFRKSHYILALIYMAACWLHWKGLQCFIIPSLVLWGVDRFIRLVRSGLIHYRVLDNGRGVFTPIEGEITRFGKDGEGVVRMKCVLPAPWSWSVGQHFYVTFLEGGIWQAHPFTPLSLPEGMGDQELVFLFRGKKGETKRIVEADFKVVKVILTGPYGVDILDPLFTSYAMDLEAGKAEGRNVLCLAGGTGITYVLPVLLALSRRMENEDEVFGAVQLVWIIRHMEDEEWIRPELDILGRNPRIKISIHVTRDRTLPSLTTSSTSSSISPAPSLSHDLEKHLESTPLELTSRTRPDVKGLIQGFMGEVVSGPVFVYTSGPSGMLGEVKCEIARWNEPGEVWKGKGRGDVRLILDDRGE